MLRWLIIVTALGAIPWTGCASPVVQDSAELDEIQAASPSQRSGSAAASPRGGSSSSQSSAETAGEKPAVDQADAELIELLAELRRTGAIDQTVQQNIIKDWHAADRAVRPQLLEMFRTTLSYRRENAANKPALESTAGKATAANQATEHNVTVAAPHHDVSNDVSTGKPLIRRIRQPAVANPDSALQCEQTEASPSTDEQVILHGRAGSPSPSFVEVSSASETSLPSTHAKPVDSRPQTENASLAAQPANKITPVAASARPSEITDSTWEEHLSSALVGLEGELSDSPGSASDVARHAGLRLLYLLDGRRSEALRPIDGLPPSQQDFWSEQLYGLAAYMDSERNQDAARRSAEASHHFREALARLNNLATLEVKNLGFCTDVKSFGVYEPFTKNVFRAGQEVLIYAEVENFSSELVEKGHKISLRTSYQILDLHGARVAKQEFPTVASECRALRRDLFVSYSVFLPQRIYPGKYTLHLSVEDLQSQKLGSSSIQFEIDEK
jgi:hypothetical protein